MSSLSFFIFSFSHFFYLFVHTLSFRVFLFATEQTGTGWGEVEWRTFFLHVFFLILIEIWPRIIYEGNPSLPICIPDSNLGARASALEMCVLSRVE